MPIPPRTFVGFGFGAIQGGLFLYEAHRSGKFARLVVAEVVPEVVEAIRRSGGCYRVNVATRTGIEVHEISKVEIYNPLVPADAAKLAAAFVGTPVSSNATRTGGPIISSTWSGCLARTAGTQTVRRRGVEFHKAGEVCAGRSRAPSRALSRLRPKSSRAPSRKRAGISSQPISTRRG